MDSNPPLSSLPALLRELDDRPEDTEHGSVAVSHESEWCMAVSRGGYVIFEHLERGGERHMRAVPDAKIIELWSRLAQGDIGSIESEAWVPGYR
jgi:putative hemolysin